MSDEKRKTKHSAKNAGNQNKMKKLILVCLLFTGCASVNDFAYHADIPPDELKNIPEGAKDIIIIVNRDTDKVFDEIMMILVNDGFRIDESSNKYHYVNTEGIEIGYATSHRMTISVRDNSKVVIKTEWTTTSYTHPNWYPAIWYKGLKKGYAFAKSYSVARQIKDGKISFTFD